MIPLSGSRGYTSIRTDEDPEDVPVQQSREPVTNPLISGYPLPSAPPAPQPQPQVPYPDPDEPDGDADTGIGSKSLSLSWYI